jgi:hypothetical protein
MPKSRASMRMTKARKPIHAQPGADSNRESSRKPPEKLNYKGGR